MSDRRIGVDFDNTLALYNLVFRNRGVARGLLPADFRGDKNAVRAAIRALPDGEMQWTALQAEVYGPQMSAAELAPGALAVVATLQRRGWQVCIVSHKSRFAAADPATDLRAAAWRWLASSGLLAPEGGPIDGQDVFFEDSRAAKIARIRALGCSSFIDDLEEVFLEPDFPADIARYLLVLDPHRNPTGPFQVVRSWAAFGDRMNAASSPAAGSGHG